MPVTQEDLLNEARKNVDILELDQAQALIDQGAVVLDVRESGEFERGHLPNAVHISRGLLEFMVGNHPALKDTASPVLVYCKSGGRSLLATDLLKRMGFENAVMLGGGIDLWTENNHQVEVDPNQYQ